MVGLAIRFELGRYHATPWGSHVNDAAVEWPPSPWRIIRALYSTGRTDTRLLELRAALDGALQALIDAPPPVFELPPSLAAHTRHYMPQLAYSALHTAATSKVLDGFLAIDPAAELKVWWDTSLTADAADALAATARSLGYLGRSESVCSARMVSGAGPDRASARPAASMDVIESGWDLTDLLCPQRGRPLDTATVSVTDMRKSRLLLPEGTERLTYAVLREDPTRAPTQAALADRPPTLALFRLRGADRPALTEAVAIGQLLRSALQHAYGAGNRSTASPTFSGRSGDTPREDQHRHAHYISIPSPHHGRVDQLLVWAPEGFGPAEVAALARVDHISIHGIPKRLPVALAALSNETGLLLDEVLGPARIWRSATPFGLVRHPKVRRGQMRDSPEDQVRRELSLRGLPEPSAVRLERGSWHRFRSAKAGQSRLQRASVFGVKLEFEEPIPGPIAIGAFCHFGLGMFTPQKP